MMDYHILGTWFRGCCT